MILYKLNKNKTVASLYSDTLNARSVGVDDLVIMTPFSSNITCKVQYYDVVTEKVVGLYTAMNIESNKIYSEYVSNSSESYENGITYIHTIPEDILKKSGELKFSFMFYSADGKVITTGILTEEVVGSTWEFDVDEDSATVLDNRYWPVASTTQLGLVKIDEDSILMSEDGTIRINPDVIAVEANPVSDEATADLSRIRVGETVYNVVGTSGSGGMLYVISDDDGNVVLGFN